MREYNDHVNIIRCFSSIRVPSIVTPSARETTRSTFYFFVYNVCLKLCYVFEAILFLFHGNPNVRVRVGRSVDDAAAGTAPIGLP